MQDIKKTKNAFAVVVLAIALALSLFSIVHADTSSTPTPPSSLPRPLFYITNSRKAIESLRAHVSSLDIVAPQTYAAMPNGKMLGKPNTEVINIAKEVGAQVMPLIVNSRFSQKGMHKFLQDPVAQNRLLGEMVTEAKAQGYIGFQYDFEHMMAYDRDMYSAFVKESADAFHASGLQLSVAMAPQHSDNPQDYGKGSWQNWTGAFDYEAIGKAVDFVSVMAYDDSKSVGPVASIPWVKDVVSFTLARIPAEKVSLGVPFYTWDWSVRAKRRVGITGYGKVAKILSSGTYLEKGWSPDLGVSWVTYLRRGKKYTAWYEDQKSFEQKLALVSGNKLVGYSAWALGMEDPKIWDTIVATSATSSGDLALHNTR